MAGDELAGLLRPNPGSIAAHPCPTCGRPRIVPRGSGTPRCQVCEAELLWSEAEQAWLDAPDGEKW